MNGDVVLPAAIPSEPVGRPAASAPAPWPPLAIPVVRRGEPNFGIGRGGYAVFFGMLAAGTLGFLLVMRRFEPKV